MVSSQWRELASAVVSSTLIVALLLISVIGIPWGIRQLMRFALIYGDRVAAYADSTNEDIQPSLDSSKGT